MIERISRTVLFPAVVALVPVLAVAPADAAPPPSFGPSETGCPAFFTGTVDEPPADPGQVGPFGTSQQRLTGIGLAADGEALTVSLGVEDMRRQAAPGYRWTYWEVFFSVEGHNRGKQLEVYYDAVQDEFTWWAGPYNGSFAVKTAVDGTVVTGPGGGVAISVPLSVLQMTVGDVVTNVTAEAGNFVSYVYMNPPDYLTGTFPSGVYAPQWSLDGPDVFTVVPCPGIAVEALDLGKGRGARLIGGALPPEAGQPVRVEQQVDGAWIEVGSGETFELGQISVDARVAPGVATLRATVTTRVLGEVSAALFTVTLT